MSARYDVIVIGAGIEGSSCAYSLAREGQSVLLLEQFPVPHTRGSSHGQSRITRYAYPMEFYVRMMLDAFPMWEERQAESGVDFFVNCGVLDLRSSTASANIVTSALSAHSVPHELLSSSDVQRRFPAIKLRKGDSAVFDPSGGILKADRALAATQKLFLQRGGTLHDSESVLSIQPGSPIKVVTSRGIYASSKLVISTGAWAGRLTSALGLKLRLKPIRVYPMYWRSRPGWEQAHGPSHLPCIIDSRSVEGYYYLPTLEYPGLVKGANHQGPDCNPDFRDDRSEDGTWVVEDVTAGIKSTFPGLETSPAITETCMYTVTPDEHPYIDRHPVYNNIVIAAGFSGHGFKLAPAVGKAVMEMVLDRPPTYNMEPFRIDRFDTKANL